MIMLTVLVRFRYFVPKTAVLLIAVMSIGSAGYLAGICMLMLTVLVRFRYFVPKIFYSGHNTSSSYPVTGTSMPCVYSNVCFFLFQHICSRCLQGFHSEKRVRAHNLSQCIKCPQCGDYLDQRHINKCQGRKRGRGALVLCPLCLRLRSAHTMHEHMLHKHGQKDYQPDYERPLLREVSIR